MAEIIFIHYNRCEGIYNEMNKAESGGQGFELGRCFLFTLGKKDAGKGRP